MIFEDYPELIAKTAAANEVSPELIVEILRLEPQFKILEAYGNRPALKRRLAELVDAANPASSESSG